VESRQEHHERTGVTYTLRAIPHDDSFLASWACPQCGGSWKSSIIYPTTVGAIERAREEADNHHTFKHRGLKRRRR
jgi:hypothetical protein